MADTLASAAPSARRSTPYSFPEFYCPSLIYPGAPFREMFARTAQRVPERPAIFWRDMTLSYRQIYVLARSAAVVMQALGKTQG
jgi:non-ribosomal peptide synthetase component E (peptide arylation enzyme)